VSGPRRRIPSRTPENVVGACSDVTVRTEPGISRSGCRFEKRVDKIFCFSGGGRLFCKYGINPLPTRSDFKGGTTGFGGIIAVLENGYGDILVDNIRVAPRKLGCAMESIQKTLRRKFEFEFSSASAATLHLAHRITTIFAVIFMAHFLWRDCD
jgi:hypothetical protein